MFISRNIMFRNQIATHSKLHMAKNLFCFMHNLLFGKHLDWGREKAEQRGKREIKSQR